MQIKRKLNRLFFYTVKFWIRLVSLINHRLYMTLYIPLIKKQGMIINGTPRYIGPNVVFDDFNLIQLGHRVVISDQCHFLTHDYSITTALIATGKPPTKDIALVRGIKIGNNVFIGKKTIVMPNTKVGNNVIVGAGTVLRGNIPDNSIVIGNPCQIIDNIQNMTKRWEKMLNSEHIRRDK